jgi:hypothetical protein
MKRIAMLAGAALMGAMGSLGSIVALEPAPTTRSPVAPKKRVSKSGKRRIGRSKYMPHQGTKERERAARCYMQPFHGRMSDYSPNLRSASVVHQVSMREFEAREDRRNVGR